MCVVADRVFEPVCLMHRDLDVHAQIGVEMMSDPSSDARVYLVFTCRRCLVFAFFFRFALPTHTVDPPTTNYPSSTTLSHAPPFALADSLPPIASTAVPNPPKQALHPLQSSHQPAHPASLRCMELCTANSPPAPLCARHRSRPGEILEQQAHWGAKMTG